MNFTSQIVLFLIDKMLRPVNVSPPALLARSGCGGDVFACIEIVAKKMQNAANFNAGVAERMRFLRGLPIVNTSRLRE